jgi:hypothetical protein
MTSTAARSSANAILVCAGVAAAYAIFTTPRLRRLTVRAMQAWLGASVPIYLLNEVRHAWGESASDFPDTLTDDLR